MKLFWYFGQTKRLQMSFPVIGVKWETSLYGFSIGNVFFGVMVRGKREVTHDA